MVYCRECGVEVDESDIYCWNCGRDLGEDSDDRSVEQRAEDWWELVERLIDMEVDDIGSSDVEVPPPLLDKFTYAYKMYIIGVMKGRLQIMLWTAAEEHEDSNLDDIDLSPVYQYLKEAVEEREDDIRRHLEESGPEKD